MLNLLINITKWYLNEMLDYYYTVKTNKQIRQLKTRLHQTGIRHDT